MARLNVLLAALVFFSALLLVTARDEARKLFIERDLMRKQQNELAAQWNTLEVEQSRLSKAAKIDAVARRKLGMRKRVPEHTMYLTLHPSDSTARLAEHSPDGKSVQGRR
ncbi:MAG: cell division protein FtsL [Burkholderiaceae bacterium]